MSEIAPSNDDGKGRVRPGPHRPKGRGAVSNPANRFERLSVVYEEQERFGEDGNDGRPVLQTEFFKDFASTIITRNNSPDLGFDYSLNPYRGCEHGCSYCYARPYHEFLGLSAGLDFESRIMVKHDAPGLLRRELSKPNWEPGVLALSGVTDAYQPVEKKLMLTRRCLEVLAEFCHPVSIITKNGLVARDVDVLARLAAHNAAQVTLSITTLDPELARAMEPRTSSPRQRMETITQLRDSGIRTGVNIAPVIPGLNDHEIPHILEAAASAGAVYAGWGMLRLPYGVKDIFLDWLDQHFPNKKARVLARIRNVRKGKLDDGRFGKRFTGDGIFAEQIRALFAAAARRLGLETRFPELSTSTFRRLGPEQLELAGF